MFTKKKNVIIGDGIYKEMICIIIWKWEDYKTYIHQLMRTQCLGIKANKWDKNEIITNQNQSGNYNKSRTNQLQWTNQSMCWLGEDANSI